MGGGFSAQWLLSGTAAPVFAAPAIRAYQYELHGAAPRQWSAQVSAVEQIDKRTQHSKTFANLDGSFTSVLVKDLHYEVAPGWWDDVDLAFSPEGGNYAMRKHPRQNIVITSSGIDITAKATGKGIRWYTPAPPIPAGSRARYSEQDLRWEYEITNRGVKSTAVVTASRGPQTYTFTYKMLGGAAEFTINVAGDAVGEGFTVPHPTVLGADGLPYTTGPWEDVKGPRLSFTFDDTALPSSAYPYVIDPTTTLHPGAGGFDNVIGERVQNLNMGADTTMYLGDNYRADPDAKRFLLKWDLSSIPAGDTITNADMALFEIGAADAEGVGSWAAELQRLRRDWSESQSTWNDYIASNAWSEVDPKIRTGG